MQLQKRAFGRASSVTVEPIFRPYERFRFFRVIRLAPAAVPRLASDASSPTLRESSDTVFASSIFTRAAAVARQDRVEIPPDFFDLFWPRDLAFGRDDIYVALDHEFAACGRRPSSARRGPSRLIFAASEYWRPSLENIDNQ